MDEVNNQPDHIGLNWSHRMLLGGVASAAAVLSFVLAAPSRAEPTLGYGSFALSSGTIPMPRVVRQCAAYFLIHPGDSEQQVEKILGLSRRSSCLESPIENRIYDGVRVRIDTLNNKVERVVCYGPWPWDELPVSQFPGFNRHNKVHTDYGQLRLLQVLGIYQ